jgi:hypothetical protein
MTETSPSFVFDAITGFVNEVAMIDDPVDRLAALQYALTLSRRRLAAARDAAAHEARMATTAEAIVRRTGFAADSVREWARSHAERTGDTRSVRPRARELSRAVVLDVNKRAVVPQQRPA